ncbi:CheR family methyltransferase [Megalodesulfovibrio paquesii]
MSTVICRTVGLGASAGGLEALEDFFQSIPETVACAFVLVMHQDPQHHPLLADLLTRHTKLPAVLAEDGMPLEAGRIHIIPPGTVLTQHTGVLRLQRASAQRTLHHPIDEYFKSLAKDAEGEAVGVIFSGAGSDGAQGLKEISVAGGIAMVQEPATARFDSMPLAALAAGAADIVLSPAQLALRLLDILRHPPHLRQDQTLRDGPDASLLDSMLPWLEQHTGLAFKNYKRTTLIRRIDKRMRLRDAGTLAAYRELLEHDADEGMALARELSISVTSFFRDPDVFSLLEREVLPALFSGNKDSDDLRLWVPGCASGEEAYSIAMLLQEYMRRHAVRRKISIFATDVDDTAIARARAGLYPQSAVAELPGALLHRYFLFQNGDYSVNTPLRKMIVFARHDLFSTPPFSRLDLISCRNLLIYLTPSAQNTLLPLFHHSLRPGGHLVLGVAESLGEHARLFTPVHPKWKVFLRREIPTPPPEYPLLVKGAPLEETVVRKLAATPPQVDLAQLFQRTLLKTFTPPSLLVDEHDALLHTEGDLTPFLELPQGKFTSEIARLVRPSLQLPVRNALRQARRQGRSIVLQGLSMPERPQSLIDIQVHPLRTEAVQEQCLMLSFVERLRPAPMPAEDGAAMDDPEICPVCCDAHDELISRLEEELRITSEQLRLAVQDLEASNQELMASNEELLSMNEELQSSNEELETSQEELQALNEELTSVNTELQANILELDRSRSDLENLFRATDIATVFLDCSLIIRQFTPAATGIFHVQEGDSGRPLQHFASQIQGLDIATMAEAVQATRGRVEQVVHTSGGPDQPRRSFLSRMFPYYNMAGEMDGLVLTFVDITDRQRMEDELRQHRDRLELLVQERTRQLAASRARLRTLLDHFPNGVVLLFDQDLRFLVAAGEVLPVLGLPQLEGHTLPEMQDPELATLLEPLFRQALAGRSVRQDLLCHGQTLDVWVLPVCNEAGEPEAGMVMAQLVTEQRRIQRELSETLDRFKKAFRANPSFMLISTLEEGRIVEVNDALCAMTGYTRQELMGKCSTQVGIIPSPEERTAFVHALRTNGALHQKELRIGTKRGAVLNTLISAELIVLGGEPHILTAGMDLSERIRRENQLAAVMEQVPAAVWIAHDPQCSRLEGSRAAYELMRQLPTSGGPPPRIFQNGQELPLAMQPLQRAAREGRPLLDFEQDLLFDDGEVRHLIGNAVPLRDNTGEITGSVAAFLDISERVHMEQHLKEARLQAEEANRAKTAFLANMSHELRTPLNGIMGMAQLVQISTLEKELQDQADMIIEASRHLQSLIDDLMDISQIESNQIKIRSFRTEVQEVLQRLTAMHQPEADRKGIALQCLVDDNVPESIEVDGKRLAQILNNLMNNALKFTERGSVSVHVSIISPAAETPPSPGAFAGTSRIRFAVRDTGIGIIPGQHEAIFKTFYQVEPHLTRSSQGTGLGLSISQRLARLMGGDITLQSSLGLGSLFTLELPCQASPALPQEERRTADPAPLGDTPLHVLVVEDNSVSRLFMTTMLKKSGCTVDEAMDGVEAVEKVRSAAYDVVFMDIQMPRMNGLDATRALRADADSRVRNCRVIALTAYAMPEDKQQFLDVGMDGFLAKPVTFDELHAILQATQPSSS